MKSTTNQRKGHVGYNSVAISGGASYRQGREPFSFGPYLGPYHSATAGKPKK